MLAKGCAIWLVLLVLSPVTAPFRTFDAAGSCGVVRSTVSVPVGSDLASMDATLTTDPRLAKSIAFDSDLIVATPSGVLPEPLYGAGTEPIRAADARVGCSCLSPVLRL